jgi:hypothetical protein
MVTDELPISDWRLQITGIADYRNCRLPELQITGIADYPELQMQFADL